MIPETSTTLLRDLASGSANARWGEFCSRYEPMMRAYLRECFPVVEADDVVQETLIALARALPNYHYNPKEQGFFHNYLTGILRNKALDAVRKRDRIDRLKADVALELSNTVTTAREAEYCEWRKSIFEIALQQLLADDSMQERTKQMFVRTEIDGEEMSAVAESLGVSVSVVYKARSRCFKQLAMRVEALKSV